MVSDIDKAAVFILLGQSNAVGHGIPMKDDDKISIPLKNVFGLSRTLNQSFDNDSLYWSGYTSNDMNLAEEQDDTYSVANCLANLWQAEIDAGNKYNLPDLYIVHIAIGSQGVTDEYMWHPRREKRLIPGKLGTVDVSLFPFTVHILSLVKESINRLGKTPEIIGLHWRGGESDAHASDELLKTSLKEIYNTLFKGFYTALDENVSTVLHKIVCHEKFLSLDPSGGALRRIHYINAVFEELCEKNDNITIFDPCTAPQFLPDVKGNGIFIEDAIHFTPEANNWVAHKILEDCKSKIFR